MTPFEFLKVLKEIQDDSVTSRLMSKILQDQIPVVKEYNDEELEKYKSMGFTVNKLENTVRLSCKNTTGKIQGQ